MRQVLTMGTRLVSKRVKGYKVVEYEGHFCHVEMKSNGLGCVAITDREYPARVAATLIRDLTKQFEAENGRKWQPQTKDDSMPFAPLDKALVEYQDPRKVDKIMRIQQDLEETKDVLHETIDKVLARGEKLDDLVAKSDDLTSQSKLFYKQAKKTNSCCTIM